MKRKSFQDMGCPIARSLEQVGEWWSILIIRDSLAGLSKFDEFQKSLDIAPNMLTRRLNSLVEAGLLARRQYNDHPPRFEYVPTERADDFRMVLLSMLTWGNKHCMPEGVRVQIAHTKTGEIAEPILVDRKTNKPILSDEFELVSRPSADPIQHHERSNASGSSSAANKPTEKQPRTARR